MKFRDKVFNIVKGIPRGEVLSYQEIARRAGSPGACRAVGNILNNNPDPKRIPCHRVIKSNGQIGGFKHGTKRKTSLLKQEGVIIRRGRVAV